MSAFLALVASASANRGANGYNVHSPQGHVVQGAAGCSVIPGMEPWGAHCDTHAHDEDGCKTYSSYCNWTAGGGGEGESNTPAPVAPAVTTPAATDPAVTTPASLGGDCTPCTDDAGENGWCKTNYSQFENKLDEVIWWPLHMSYADQCKATVHNAGKRTCACPPAPEPATPTQAPVNSTPAATWPSEQGSSNAVMNELEKKLRAADYSNILKWQPLKNVWEPSNLYKAPDLLVAVKKAVETGVGSFHLFDFASENKSVERKAEYAMVNIAAFLAQSMQETIQYDACDENNWDWESYTGGQYARQIRSASACGQLSQNYQNYTCGIDAPDGSKYECEVDPNMEIVATTNARYWGAPGPLFCGPKSKMPVAPIWVGTEAGGSCKDWDNGGADISSRATTFDEISNNLKSGKKCTEYGPGQQVGGYVIPSAEEATTHSGFSDVEGCCWWGRGVIQTTGVCNFGKLNYFLGARAKDREGSALYGDVDFCKNPGEICSNAAYPDLKWFAGLFYYMQEVQPWNDAEFSYYNDLIDVVESGYSSEKLKNFIGSVSGIVNRGCPLANCGNGPTHAGPEREAHFINVLKGFGVL